MTKNEREVRALMNRGLRGGLDEEESRALCERLQVFFKERNAWLTNLKTDIEHVLADGLDGDVDPLLSVYANVDEQLETNDCG